MKATSNTKQKVLATYTADQIRQMILQRILREFGIMSSKLSIEIAKGGATVVRLGEEPNNDEEPVEMKDAKLVTDDFTIEFGDIRVIPTGNPNA